MAFDACEPNLDIIIVIIINDAYIINLCAIKHAAENEIYLHVCMM